MIDCSGCAGCDYGTCRRDDKTNEKRNIIEESLCNWNFADKVIITVKPEAIASALPEVGNGNER